MSGKSPKNLLNKGNFKTKVVSILKEKWPPGTLLKTKKSIRYEKDFRSMVDHRVGRQEIIEPGEGVTLIDIRVGMYMSGYDFCYAYYAVVLNEKGDLCYHFVYRLYEKFVSTTSRGEQERKFVSLFRESFEVTASVK